MARKNHILLCLYALLLIVEPCLAQEFSMEAFLEEHGLLKDPSEPEPWDYEALKVISVAQEHDNIFINHQFCS